MCFCQLLCRHEPTRGVFDTSWQMVRKCLAARSLKESKRQRLSGCASSIGAAGPSCRRTWRNMSLNSGHATSAANLANFAGPGGFDVLKENTNRAGKPIGCLASDKAHHLLNTDIS